jgi:tetratricopeptide (TPR) repeat protein
VILLLSLGTASVAAAPATVRAPAKSDRAPVAEPAGASDLPKFTPGQETRVDDPSVGALGHYVVYVPKDYTPDRSWPAIFFYHGVNMKPTSWPFKDVVGGQGFVVVGMPLFGGNTVRAYDTIPKDITTVNRLVPVLVKQLNLDTRQLFISGFSMGGFIASEIGERTSAIWAGMLICGAGRYAKGSPLGFRGKPVYIGAGEKDDFLKTAQAAAGSYRQVGADVTFESYPGIGHGVDAGSKVLRDWLWSNGPLKQVKADLAAAKALQTAGKLGQAYARLKQIAVLPGGHEPCKEAGKLAEDIGKEAEAQLAAADKATAEKRYSEAITWLGRLGVTYDGCEFGDRAKKGLAALKSDATVQASIEASRQNAEAKSLNEQAQAAETAGDYARAIHLYEQLVAKCPKADLFEAARTRLEFLKSDKATQAAIRNTAAERGGRAWMAMAENFIRAGQMDKAKEYLQKIIEKYGDTEWGEKAKERLKRIK